MQALSHELHPSKLDLLGVVPAIRGFCSEVSARQKVDVDFTHQSVPGTVRPDIAMCLFRVLQEALQNAVRHSSAARFSVNLKGTPNALSLTVRDGGRGFDPASVSRDGGLGLTSMRERLKLVAGELVIESQPALGTTIVARVPLRPVPRRCTRRPYGRSIRVWQYSNNEVSHRATVGALDSPRLVGVCVYLRFGNAW